MTTQKRLPLSLILQLLFLSLQGVLWLLIAFDIGRFTWLHTSPGIFTISSWITAGIALAAITSFVFSMIRTSWALKAAALLFLLLHLGMTLLTGYYIVGILVGRS